ncbi:MAG TPA: DUF4032 domain-containing protein [Chloroflexi bacterium]|nr:DUF4032 domain-containing protein [Chloroflexota bacterium]
MSELVTRVNSEKSFTKARRRAFFQRILGFLGKEEPGELLSFDEVRHKLPIRGQHYAGVQVIPIDRIVGSVGRYHDFNRAFMPLNPSLRERWRRIYTAAHSQEGFPPIEVYQIGEVYFVRDGHHRVSVLKALGATHVEAQVIVCDCPVPLSPDVQPDELRLKEEYAIFLERTGLDRIRPDQRIEFSIPGQYIKLEEHIAVHRYFLGLREKREIPYEEAVAHWYDEVYMPIVRIIREENILEKFPGRTEADLYLWIVEHHYFLREAYGREVPFEEAAIHFAENYGHRPFFRRLLDELMDTFSRGGSRDET